MAEAGGREQHDRRDGQGVPGGVGHQHPGDLAGDRGARRRSADPHPAVAADGLRAPCRWRGAGPGRGSLGQSRPVSPGRCPPCEPPPQSLPHPRAPPIDGLSEPLVGWAFVHCSNSRFEHRFEHRFEAPVRSTGSSTVRNTVRSSDSRRARVPTICGPHHGAVLRVPPIRRRTGSCGDGAGTGCARSCSAGSRRVPGGAMARPSMRSTSSGGWRPSRSGSGRRAGHYDLCQHRASGRWFLVRTFD